MYKLKKFQTIFLTVQVLAIFQYSTSKIFHAQVELHK